jgi:hypothetical protein
LRSQIETVDGITIQQQFLHRVASQAGGVVDVGVTANDTEYPLRY